MGAPPYRLDHSFIQTLERIEGKSVSFLTKILDQTNHLYFEVLGRIVSAELINKDMILKLRITDPINNQFPSKRNTVYDNENSLVAFVIFPSNMKYCFQEMNYCLFDKVVNKYILGQNSQFRLHRVPILTTSTTSQIIWVLLDFKISDIYDTFLHSMIE
ncbi:hypothetical protein ACO0RG_000985 [Hanseniaspora osmophila]